MDYKIVYFNDVSQEQWDTWVSGISTASYFHSWFWIDYSSKFQNVASNGSFAYLDSNSKLLAICPLIESVSNESNEISANGAPVGTPVLQDNLKPGVRRNILDNIFSIIQDYAKAHVVKKIIMATHPLSHGICDNDISCFMNSFEFLRYRILYHVTNTTVIDLRLPYEVLFQNIGKYHRRHITRGQKKDITVKVFNSRENTGELKNRFKMFQDEHFTAAGKMTRPQETWDSMYSSAMQGSASLFCAFLGDIPVSYLFCGQFSSMAFGWSQVNVKEYEKTYSPRHLLEWEAINYYKKNGFSFYEIGERYYAPQLLHVPTEKQITISQFKERYGGSLLPKITWLGYFDKDALNGHLKACVDHYGIHDNLVKIPGADEQDGLDNDKAKTGL